jgi:histidinol-phosphate aminotransferase
LALSHRNIIVTRTFSKAFCLASVRVGYLVAHPTTVEELKGLYNPKSVNAVGIVAAQAALKELDYYQDYIQQVNQNRADFIASLNVNQEIAFSGGHGNFVCVKTENPEQLCTDLEKHNIYIRNIDGRFPGYVRITIGSEITRVLELLKKINT